MGDEHLDTIPSVENLVPIPSELEGISDYMCNVPVCEDPSTFNVLNDHSEILSDSNDDGTSSDDDDFEDIEYVSLKESLITNIRIFERQIPFLNRVLKVSHLSPISPCTDSGFHSLGVLTSLSHLDNSLPAQFEPFSDDTEENENTTTHADFSQYDSFIFDLSIDSFPPADRSDFYHEEFADELAHIISPPEYDSFLFEIEPDQGELTNVVTEEVNTFLVPEDSIPGIESNFDPGGGDPDYEDPRVSLVLSIM
ncbi:hypothetical protein Tco_0606430 [Tanacetum coccineum]